MNLFSTKKSYSREGCLQCSRPTPWGLTLHTCVYTHTHTHGMIVMTDGLAAPVSPTAVMSELPIIMLGMFL